jgi:hypothetical protein
VPCLHNADFLRRAKGKLSKKLLLDVRCRPLFAQAEPVSGSGVAPAQCDLRNDFEDESER